MSFADLERGEGGIKRGGVAGPSPLSRSNMNSSSNSVSGNAGNFTKFGRGDIVGDVHQHAHDAKVKYISEQVFRISTNVSSIQRLVGFLGTLKDSQSVRTKLQDITEQTQALVRDTSQDIKDLAKFDSGGKKLEHQKVSKDFSKVLVEFQKVQRVSAEKQRDFILKARQVGSQNDYANLSDDEGGDAGDQPLINDDQRRLQLLVVDNELEYNESMITQREDEIREIERGITELNEIFRDLGSMVHEQGDMLDSVESNVTSISMTTHAAAEELTTAAEHQKSASSKSCYLLLIAAVVS
ncbi:hypothetical protein EDD11_008734, partial [Mortierella claussenii]